MKKYVALFEFGENSVGVVFPDLPGLTSAGDNFDDAFKNAHEALSLYADGEKNMPKPRTLEQIKEQWPDWQEWKDNYEFTAGIVDLVPLSTKSKRINITLPEDLLYRIDNITNNRSGFIDSAVRRALAA
ncbi:MAG: hypothetical protein E7011_01970 [Alphaproteobacteria bacterium]|nr:hypothetical protein [Alphaproteobacteria bacterium]